MITVIVAVIGILVALFFKKQADDATTASTLGVVKGKDSVLVTEQDAAKKAIKDLDAGITKMNADREAQRAADENMTLAERAAAIRKGLQ